MDLHLKSRFVKILRQKLRLEKRGKGRTKWRGRRELLAPLGSVGRMEGEENEAWVGLVP